MVQQNYDINVRVNNAQDIKKLEGALGNSQRALLSLGTAAKAAAIGLATVGSVQLLRSFVSVGKEVESLRLRFKFLFGSAQEGAAAFDTLNSFAATVPFSLEEIAAGAGNLATVASGAEELNDVLRITANVAAVAGLDFRTASEQIQRAFAGGASAADIFRERGILALLGFQQGAATTVDETVAKFTEAFGPGGRFGKASEEFATTLAGTLSMLGDKFRKFQEAVAEEFFDELKRQLGDLNGFFDDNSDVIDEFAKTLGQSLATAVRSAGSAMVFLKENADLVKAALVGMGIVIFINQIGRLTTSIIALRTAFAALNATMLKNPFVLIAAALTAGVVALKDYFDGLQEADKAQQDLNKTNEQALILYEDMGLAERNRIKRIKEAQKAEADRIKATEEFLKKNKSKLEEIERLGENELDAEYRKMEEQKQLVKDAMDAGVYTREQANERILEIEEAAAKRRATIYDKELKSQKKAQEDRIKGIRDGTLEAEQLEGATQEEKVKIALEGGREILKNLATFNKKAFELNKAVAITEAIINTSAAATRALRGLPPPFNFIAAGAVVAAGLAQVAAIRSQQYPGREDGGTVMGNKPYLVGEAGPEVVVPGRTGTVVPNNELFGQANNVNINFNIQTIDASGFDQLLRSRQGVIIGVINQALNEKGRRALV